MQFAEKHETVYMNKKWRRIIFIDEKKFNLKGPDGFYCYYRDLRNKQRLLSRRSIGGGGIIVCGAIGNYGKLEIKFITEKLNSNECIEMIDEQVNTYATENKYILWLSTREKSKTILCKRKNSTSFKMASQIPELKYYKKLLLPSTSERKTIRKY